MTEKVVWHVVKQYAGRVGIVKLAPHDLYELKPELLKLTRA